MNYRKSKQVQHKPNFASANKSQSQIKATDGSKAFNQPKHKHEGAGKMEGPKNTSKNSAQSTTECEAVPGEHTVPVATSSTSTQTHMTRPKTDPVPVPHSPKTSS